MTAMSPEYASLGDYSRLVRFTGPAGNENVSLSHPETAFCQPRQVQGQRLQNSDCDRRSSSVRSAAEACEGWCESFASSKQFANWFLNTTCASPQRILTDFAQRLRVLTTLCAPPQWFGYSNSSGRHQPQHPRPP